jgi:hypothetical protein
MAGLTGRTAASKGLLDGSKGPPLTYLNFCGRKMLQLRRW